MKKRKINSIRTVYAATRVSSASSAVPRLVCERALNDAIRSSWRPEIKEKTAGTQPCQQKFQLIPILQS
jgi:hypothetical protein